MMDMFDGNQPILIDSADCGQVRRLNSAIIRLVWLFADWEWVVIWKFYHRRWRTKRFRTIKIEALYFFSFFLLVGNWINSEFTKASLFNKSIFLFLILKTNYFLIYSSKLDQMWDFTMRQLKSINICRVCAF